MSDEMFADLEARGFFEIISDEDKWDAWQKANIERGIPDVFIYKQTKDATKGKNPCGGEPQAEYKSKPVVIPATTCNYCQGVLPSALLFFLVTHCPNCGAPVHAGMSTTHATKQES